MSRSEDRRFFDGKKWTQETGGEDYGQDAAGPKDSVSSAVGLSRQSQPSVEGRKGQLTFFTEKNSIYVLHVLITTFLSRVLEQLVREPFRPILELLERCVIIPSIQSSSLFSSFLPFLLSSAIPQLHFSPRMYVS